MNTNYSGPAVAVDKLCVDIHKHRVVDNVSFTVPVGSTTAIIGPNGAGKSVLVKSLLRLIPKSSGNVSVFGIPHERYRDIAPLISYIPQRLNFKDNFPLTVKGLFELKSPRPLGMSPAEAARMEEVLQVVGMQPHVHKRLSELSGGQLQRVLIAYSLTDHPKLLFLDEPSAGIDAEGQETIYALLERIRAEENLTMVLISHELEVIMQYADQVLCLNQSLLCAGAPGKVLTEDLLKQMYGTGVGRYEHSHADHD